MRRQMRTSLADASSMLRRGSTMTLLLVPLK
jgi:hypothetical protein